MRDLTEEEKKKKAILDVLGIPNELLHLTETGLKKSILDATAPIVDLLNTQEIHDYDAQLKGNEHKVMLPCIILNQGNREDTKISFYRPNSKDGDARFWPGRFNKFAETDQLFLMFIENSNIVLLNLSDNHNVYVDDGSHFAEILNSIQFDSSEFKGIQDFGEETKVDDPESSEIAESSRFEVSSYGWDSDVEGLVKRLNRGDIKLPGFQRGFVWSQVEQSRFIESLVLGLPVPNIFLAQDRYSKTLNIVDGQQRLKTLQRFLAGKFAISNSKKIHEELRGCYFNREVAKTPKSKVLNSADERILSDSILHSIVIRPDPSSDSAEYGHEYNNAVIQIFRRLNTSGKALQPQEVRSCVFYGRFDDLLHSLNKNESWRSLFGREHSRYKDVETILRFFALYEKFEDYRAPMPSFLDRYMEDNRNIGQDKLDDMRKLFEKSIKVLFETCGESLFKTGGTLLLSKFDAVTVGVAKLITKAIDIESSQIQSRLEELIVNQEYIDATNEFINDTENVIGRINAAINIFHPENGQ